MERVEGYIGGPTGGIPNKIFCPDFADRQKNSGQPFTIEGQSGLPLECRVTENVIDIRDKEYAFWFTAEKDGDTICLPHKSLIYKK